jgi:hypothetical protein
MNISNPNIILLVCLKTMKVFEQQALYDMCRDILEQRKNDFFLK